MPCMIGELVGNGTGRWRNDGRFDSAGAPGKRESHSGGLAARARHADGVLIHGSVTTVRHDGDESLRRRIIANRADPVAESLIVSSDHHYRRDAVAAIGEDNE